ncbi:MAG: hypothetical protein H8E32_00530, partial [Nitrospinae bacterium]|nr:hypothetical protein [Nitrospinota bacterium]
SMSIRKEGRSFFVKPFFHEPDMQADAPERRVEPGGEAYGVTFDELEAHGEGKMRFNPDTGAIIRAGHSECR